MINTTDKFIKQYGKLDDNDKKDVIKYIKSLKKKAIKVEKREQFTEFKDFKLYDYQKDTILDMEKYEKGKYLVTINNKIFKQITNCGILTNPIGSGKTVCVLELINRNNTKFKKKYKWKPIFTLDKGIKILSKYYGLNKL